MDADNLDPRLVGHIWQTMPQPSFDVHRGTADVQDQIVMEFMLE